MLQCFNAVAVQKLCFAFEKENNIFNWNSQNLQIAIRELCKTKLANFLIIFLSFLH